MYSSTIVHAISLFPIAVMEACALPGEKRKRKELKLLGIEANEPAMIRPYRTAIPTKPIETTDLFGRSVASPCRKADPKRFKRKRLSL
jgi:hypothetical protein